MEFTNEKVDFQYLKDNNLLKYFSKKELETIDKKYNYTDANFGNNTFYREINNSEFIPLPVDVDDLINLHKTILERKVFTIMEFGLGYSTIIMADALLKHKNIYDKLENKPHIRCNNKFEIHSVDANTGWIESFKKKLEKYPELKNIIKITYSGVHMSTFNNRMCNFYDKLPVINPQLIYIDGPDPSTIKGNINGFSFNNPDNTVLSADILLIEPVLIPGVFIIIDGRRNNSYFIENNLQRNWKIIHKNSEDITTLELQDKSLGRYNTNMLNYSKYFI